MQYEHENIHTSNLNARNRILIVVTVGRVNNFVFLPVQRLLNEIPKDIFVVSHKVYHLCLNTSDTIICT